MTQDQINSALQALGINPNTPLPSNPDIQAALTNYMTAATAVAAAFNANLIADYSGPSGSFTNWANNYLAGRASGTSYPLPPPGYVAAQAPDGWVYVIRGTDPVTAVPPLPVLPTIPTGTVLAVGTRIVGAGGVPTSYFTSSVITAGQPTLVSANVPTGFTFHTTSADGVVGSFTWIPSPFGGWWQLN